MEFLGQPATLTNWGVRADDIASEAREHLDGEVVESTLTQQGGARFYVKPGDETGVHVDVFASPGYYMLSVRVKDIDGATWERHTELGPFINKYRMAGWIIRTIAEGLEFLDDVAGTDTRKSITVPGWAR